MAIKTMIVMIIGFITSLNVCAADTTVIRVTPNNLEEQAELKSLIDDLFGKATAISVKSAVPGVELPGEEAIKSFNIKSDWDFGVSFNCRGNCGLYSWSIMAYLSSGLKTIDDCPPPFTALIELEGESAVGEIYIHETGRYFKVNGVSYYTEASFFDLAPNSSMYPAFLGR